MSVHAIIPCRYASSRFPGKPLHPIYNKPMLEWVIEGLKSSQLLEKIWVATDDERIFQLADQLGANPIRTDSNLPTGTDRVWQAAKEINCEWILNVQGDEPLILGADLDPFINTCLENQHWQMATLVSKLEQRDLKNPNTVKVILNQNQEAIYFSRFPIPFSRDENFDSKLVKKHIGVYAYRKDFLKEFCSQAPSGIEQKEGLEQLRALYMGAKIGCFESHSDFIGVDTLEDVPKVEEILKKRNEN